MIECGDEQGLALLSNPAAVSVKLILIKLFDMGKAPKRGPIRRVQREFFSYTKRSMVDHTRPEWRLSSLYAVLDG
jgi:hypothetical protein